MIWLIAGAALLLLVVCMLRVPPWCDEDWDHEEEHRLRGWTEQ